MTYARNLTSKFNTTPLTYFDSQKVTKQTLNSGMKSLEMIYSNREIIPFLQ